MAKDRIDKNVLELRKLIKDKKILVGTDRTLKALKLGNIEKVFIAINCNAKIKSNINQYSKLTKASVSTLKYPNDELGVLCKKPHSISVLGLLKGKTK